MTRIPLIGLTENQLTSADKQDWLSYYKDAEQRVKLTGDQKISAVYYSILNSSNGLQPTAITFSDDSRAVFGTFSIHFFPTFFKLKKVYVVPGFKTGWCECLRQIATSI